MFNPLNLLSKIKLEGVVFGLIVIGILAFYISTRHTINEQKETIEHQKVIINNLKVENIKTKNEAKVEKFETNQSKSKEAVVEKIKNITKTNQMITPDTNKSEIHINTIKDTGKIKSLEVNHSYILKIN